MVPKVLIAEDDEVIRREIAEYLIDHGFEVIKAADGHEAIAKFNKERPDAVLTDLMMPGHDGIEVARRVREINPDCPVIMMTGHAVSQQLQMEGVTTVLKKPIGLRELVQLLESVTQQA